MPRPDDISFHQDGGDQSGSSTTSVDQKAVKMHPDVVSGPDKAPVMSGVDVKINLPESWLKSLGKGALETLGKLKDSSIKFLGKLYEVGSKNIGEAGKALLEYGKKDVSELPVIGSRIDRYFSLPWNKMLAERKQSAVDGLTQKHGSLIGEAQGYEEKAKTAQSKVVELQKLLSESGGAIDAKSQGKINEEIAYWQNKANETREKAKQVQSEIAQQEVNKQVYDEKVKSIEDRLLAPLDQKINGNSAEIGTLNKLYETAGAETKNIEIKLTEIDQHKQKLLEFAGTTDVEGVKRAVQEQLKRLENNRREYQKTLDQLQTMMARYSKKIGKLSESNQKLNDQKNKIKPGQDSMQEHFNQKANNIKAEMDSLLSKNMTDGQLASAFLAAAAGEVIMSNNTADAKAKTVTGQVKASDSAVAPDVSHKPGSAEVKAENMKVLDAKQVINSWNESQSTGSAFRINLDKMPDLKIKGPNRAKRLIMKSLARKWETGEIKDLPGVIQVKAKEFADQLYKS